MTAVYLFDSTRVAANTTPSLPSTATYGQYGCGQPGTEHWISGAYVTVGGVEIGNRVDEGSFDNCDSMTVQDPTESFFPDYYSLTSIASDSSFTVLPDGYQSRFAFDFTNVATYSYTARFLDGLSAAQAFTYAPAPGEFGEGFLNRFGTVSRCDSTGSCNYEQWQFSLRYTIESITVGQLSVNPVSEPGALSLALLASGLALLARRRGVRLHSMLSHRRPGSDVAS